VQYGFGERNVVVHHEAFIGAGRIRARALMQDCFNAGRQGFAVKDLNEFFRLQQIGEAQITEISKILFWPVHNQNVRVSLDIQGLDNIASDKAGAAGYDPHGDTYPRAFFMK
jgi:hypothetical protein